MVGLLALSYSAAQFLAAPALGALSDRSGRRPVLLFSLLGSAVGYTIFGAAHSLTFLFVGRILDGTTGGNISPAQAYLADVSRPADRSRNFGLVGVAFDSVGAAFIKPTITGLVSRQVDARTQGAILGVLHSGASLMRVAGPAHAGWIHEHVARTAPSWTSAGVRAVAAAVVLRRSHSDRSH